VKQLAAALGCPKSTVSVVAGHKSRDKVLVFSAVTPEAALQRLQAFRETAG
jgi:uncharacterized protein YggU (UPF0235/DUF167 family)